MPGIFAGLAGALGDAQMGARAIDLQNEQRARQRKLDQEAEQERQIRMAATLAALKDQNILPAGDEQRDTPTAIPNAAAMTGTPGAAMTPQSVDTSLPAAQRYVTLGNTGYVADRLPQLRERAKREAQIQSRVNFLKATRPELRSADPEEVRAIADDDATFREMVKPQPGHNPLLHDTQQGVVAVGEDFSPHPLKDPNGRPYMPVPRGRGNVNIGGSGALPQHRRQYVQQRLDYYEKPQTVRDEDGILQTEPGLSREEATRAANADADAAGYPPDTSHPPMPAATPVTSRSGAGSVFRGAPPNADYSTPDGSTRGNITVETRTMPKPGASGSAKPKAPDSVLLELDDQFHGDNAKILAELQRRGYAIDQ